MCLGKTKSKIRLTVSENLLDILLLWKDVSKRYFFLNKKEQLPSSPLFYNAKTFEPINTKNIYNSPGFKGIGIPELRAGLMRIDATNRMILAGATEAEHELVLAHSENIAKDTYFTKEKDLYNVGEARLVQDVPDQESDDDSDHACDREQMDKRRKSASEALTTRAKEIYIAKQAASRSVKRNRTTLCYSSKDQEQDFHRYLDL